MKYLCCCLFCCVSVLSRLMVYFFNQNHVFEVPEVPKKPVPEKKVQVPKKEAPPAKGICTFIICGQKDLLAFLYFVTCVKNQDRKRIVALKDRGSFCVCLIVLV